MAAVARAARIDLETLLRARKLDNTLTSALPAPGLLDEQAVVATGIAALDERLHGGVPRGQISEIVGPRSSGRTSLLVAMLAGTTARGELAALVDTLDMFDAPSAAAGGIELGRLLWIRGQGPGAGGQGLGAGGQGNDQGWNVAERAGKAGWRTVSQRATARSAEPEPGATRSVAPLSAGHGGGWERVLDRAVKALNLVLQAGGFGLVALDLAEVPPSVVRRLPFTTWLRLQRVIEGSDTACLLLGAAPVARSAGGVTIALQRSDQQPVVSGQQPVVSGQWSAAGGQWPVADEREDTGRIRAANRVDGPAEHGLLCERDPCPPGDFRRARLLPGFDVEAHISRARWPETTPCRIWFGPRP